MSTRSTVRRAPVLCRPDTDETEKVKLVHRIQWFTRKALARTAAQDDGQTLVEYVLITGLVSVALIASLIALAGGLGELFDTITTSI